MATSTFSSADLTDVQAVALETMRNKLATRECHARTDNLCFFPLNTEEQRPCAFGIMKFCRYSKCR